MQNRSWDSNYAWHDLVLGLFFDSFSALVFVTAVVISLKIALPELTGVRVWARVGVAWLFHGLSHWVHLLS